MISNKRLCDNHQEGVEELKNELHMDKYFVGSPANEGKFSSNPTFDLPKIKTTLPLPVEGTLSLLVTSYN